MFSIYTTAFDINKSKFDYAGALENFCMFAGEEGEVKVAVPTDDQDETYETLYKWKESYHPFSNNLEIFVFRANRSDPNFDGALKNAALQECCKDICIGVDLDERLCLWQRERWVELANILKETTHESVFIPSIDLFQDEYHYKDIKHKWYLHKRKGAFRGVAAFARLENGHHDIQQSDGCELIDKDGVILPTVLLCSDYSPKFLTENNIPFVYHLGHISAEDRVLRNKNFWKEHWSVQAGEDIKVPLSVEEIEGEAKEHGLELWK